MSKHFNAAGFISVLCLAVVMTACGGTARVEEKSTESVIVTHPSRVVIETFNGNIEVVTGTDDKVAVEVTKYTSAGQREALKHIQFGISQDAETVTVKAQWPADAPTNFNFTGTDLKVSVPAGSPVQAIVGNGDVVFAAALGQGKYDMVVGNGSIELQLPAESQFSIDARVGNGRIINEYQVPDSAIMERVLVGRVGTNPQTAITAAVGNGNIKVRRSS